MLLYRVLKAVSMTFSRPRYNCNILRRTFPLVNRTQPKATRVGG